MTRPRGAPTETWTTAKDEAASRKLVGGLHHEYAHVVLKGAA